MDAQREYYRRHQRLRMKRSSILVLVSLLAVLSFSATVVGVERIVNKFVLYVRVARLYTQDPPSKIVMPLQMSKKQIANTWHAPRGADRLHEGQDIFALRGTPTYSATRGYIYNIGQNRLGGQTVSVIGRWAGLLLRPLRHLCSPTLLRAITLLPKRCLVTWEVQAMRRAHPHISTLVFTLPQDQSIPCHYSPTERSR